MVSNRKFSKVYDLVSRFEKKSSRNLALTKKAQSVYDDYGLPTPSEREMASRKISSDRIQNDISESFDTLNNELFLFNEELEKDKPQADTDKIYKPFRHFMYALEDVYRYLSEAIKNDVSITLLDAKKELINQISSLEDDDNLTDDMRLQIGKGCKIISNKLEMVKSASRYNRFKKRAQAVSSAEREATLKREIEELMTKGVAAAVRPRWQKLVEMVTTLKKSNKLPAELDALAYYQVIVHGGVAFERRVKFASAFPRVVMNLAVHATKFDINPSLTRQVTDLSKDLNTSCDTVKIKYAELVDLQDSNKTERDRNDLTPRSPTPKDSVSRDGGQMDLETATRMVKGFIRSLRSGSTDRQSVLREFSTTVGPHLATFSKDPDFKQSVEQLVELGIPVDPAAGMLSKWQKQIEALDSLKGDALSAKAQAILSQMMSKIDYFKGNKYFSRMTSDMLDKVVDLGDQKLNEQIKKIQKASYPT